MDTLPWKEKTTLPSAITLCILLLANL